MIRPITLICWALALGAGLYLYRAKHEVELMDKHIDQIAKQTGDLRADSRRLLDEWIRLGEPEQLHKYSDQYLGLKTIAPTQFARVTDLASRLPAPRADPSGNQSETLVQAGGVLASTVAAAGVPLPPAQTAVAETDETDADELPIPPIPPAATALTANAQPAVVAPPLQAKPVTPRQTAIQPDQGIPRPRVEPRIVEDSLAPPAKPVSTKVADPRQLVPFEVPWQPPGQLPSRAQIDARGGFRPTQAPTPAQGPATGPQVVHQVLAPAPVPVQAGSLLAIPSGGVPLPAPTPVSATWTGPSGSGPIGSGR